MGMIVPPPPNFGRPRPPNPLIPRVQADWKQGWGLPLAMIALVLLALALATRGLW